MTTLKIGTRESRLALWQATFVRDRLLAMHSDLEVELVGISTQGDRNQEALVAIEGGKGLFLKELEEALLDGRVDLAVHSMKDVTAKLPEGLHIPVICERGDPRDALIFKKNEGLRDLSYGATVGTCSLRRQCLLRHRVPDVRTIPLRGNVDTRLQRLDQGDFDAIILAVAGLRRLDLEQRIGRIFAVEDMLPAVGQGAIGIECRVDDPLTSTAIQPLDHADTHLRVRAERAANEALGGSCHLPIAFFAELSDTILRIRGMVGTTDGSEVLFANEQGSVQDTVEIGQRVAKTLRDQGAERILRDVGAN